MYYDPDRMRVAGAEQYSDISFYTDIVGLSDYYFDFTFINILNDEFPTLK